MADDDAGTRWTRQENELLKRENQVLRERIAHLESAVAVSRRREQRDAVVGECLGCARNTSKELPSRCPECGQQFQGKGWEGIDGHWKANHDDVLPYEQFWRDLCPAHRGD